MNERKIFQWIRIVLMWIAIFYLLSILFKYGNALRTDFPVY
jgi:hypothetical protein